MAIKPLPKKLPKRKRQKRGDVHYVNCKEFYADFVEYDKVLAPAKLEYAAMVAEAENNIADATAQIEQEYKDNIESGMSFACAKMTYDAEMEAIKSEFVVESWYSWRPPVPVPIAQKILLICQRLRYKPNFINYSFVDEMVLDAVENCIKYACKFNIEKSDNPFAYFSQISINAFIRRIQREAKDFIVKAKYVQTSALNNDDFAVQEGTTDSTDTFANSYRSFLRNFYDIDIPVAEKKVRKKRHSKEDDTHILDFGDDVE